MKTCRTCGEEKELAEFKVQSRHKGKLYHHADCRPCSANVNRAKRYGISVEDVESLLEESGHCCMICGVHADSISHSRSKHSKLYIDHNHETNTVRGVLCGNCNAGIGMLQDSPDILNKAILYLQERGTY